MTNYLYLAIAIAAEVVATTSLKAVAGFSKPLPLLLVAMFVYGQRLDPAALLGIGLIIAGVLVIQLFSRASGH
ncbi:TPA: SMR family transporter [Pseudomonas aeruginosa]